MSEVVIRELRAHDVAEVRWALYEAVSWDPDRELPPFDVTIEHPQLAIYHRDWGRPGDVGVAAEAGGAVVGVAFFRLFTDEEHGHGYVDDETPELAIAVRERSRGRGVGTLLLRELADRARLRGIRRLALSVDAQNPAVRLYERSGYHEISRDEGGVRMVLDLQ